MNNSISWNYLMSFGSKNLSTLNEIILCLMMVIGTAGLIGMANLKAFAGTSKSVATPLSYQKSLVSLDLPQLGDRVAVLLTLQNKANIVLLPEAEVTSVARGQVFLDLSKDQREIITRALRYGYLNYIKIKNQEPSPYLGQSVSNYEELEKIIKHTKKLM